MKYVPNPYEYVIRLITLVNGNEEAVESVA